MVKTTRKNVFRIHAPLLALALLAGMAAPARADSQIYKCVDEAGRVEFTDVSRRGCKLLDLPGTIAAPPPRKGQGAVRQGAPLATPSDFPRVDTAQQRARDSGRREILEDELRNEEKKLAELKREFNGGEPERQGNERNYAKYQARVAEMRDDIGRSERNVEALRRELSNIK